MTRAAIIVADPPWRFASNSKAKPGRNAMRHYDCMTLPDIADLPVAQWAARDALLFLWATSPMLPQALSIIPQWGFTYKSSFVWIKPHVATGYWVRNRHEFVLLAKRGKFPCGRVAPFSDSVIEVPTRGHSRKPEELQDAIDGLWPAMPKLEMFARRTRPGWEVWGDEVG